MIEYNNMLKVAQTNSLSLDLKRHQTVLPEQKQKKNNPDNSENFQAILNDIENEANSTIENEPTTVKNVENDISMLPSMQNNQYLCMKKKM